MSEVTMKAAPATGWRKLWLKIKRQKYLLLMILPAFVVCLLFTYVPMSGLYIAFSEYKLSKGLFEGEFVGLKYFKEVIKNSSDLGYLIRNTLVINVTCLFQNIFIPMIFAVLLKEIRWKKIAKVFQTITFFPFFVSWVIAYAVVWALFSVNSGAINQLLVQWGVIDKGLNILGNPDYSWALMILLGLWKSLGYTMILFLSAITSIPSEQYEAAQLDGASRTQRIWHITLPNLMSTAAVLLIMNAGGILGSNLEEFFVFYNSTNWSKMEVLDMYIYRYGLALLDFPYATAMSIYSMMISVALMLTVNKISKKLNQASLI